MPLSGTFRVGLLAAGALAIAVAVCSHERPGRTERASSLARLNSTGQIPLAWQAPDPNRETRST